MEYVGFLISLLAMIYLFFKQKSVDRDRQEHPERFSDAEAEEYDPMTDLLMAIEVEERKKRAVPRAPSLPQKPAKVARKGAASPLEQYRLESSVEKRHLKSALEQRHLKPSVKQSSETDQQQSLTFPQHLPDTIVREPSRAEVALRRLAHRRDLAIYQEIIDKPKGMRPSL